MTADVVVTPDLIARAVAAYSTLWEMADPAQVGKAFELRFEDYLDGMAYSFRVVMTLNGRTLLFPVIAHAWEGVVQPYAVHALVTSMQGAIGYLSAPPAGEITWAPGLPGFSEPKKPSVMADVLGRTFK